MMYEWELNFRPHILERGWDYAESGTVTNMNVNDDSISALVAGSEYYKVKIGRSGRLITEGFCTCPYAAGGEWCKHMAAVLYTFEDINEHQKEMSKTEVSDTHGDVTPIKEIIVASSREQMVSLLINLANSDNRIESTIRAELAKNQKSHDVKLVKKEIDKIFHSFSDRYGFIDYYSAMSFETNLSTFLRNRVGALIDDAQYMDAFEASMYAFIKLGNQDIDDDGEIASISKVCYELWQVIVTQCSSEEKDIIRERIEEQLCDETVVDYMEDYLQDFLEYEMVSYEELSEMISDLEKLVEKSKENNVCTSVFSSYYGYNIEAIELRNILAKKLGASDAEIDDYKRKYMNLRSVRDYFIKKARNEGDVDEEIVLLKMSKEYDKNSISFVHSYSKRLIELYKEKDETDLEKSERREEILSHQNITLEEFRAYKEMCSDDEWNDERIRIIKTRKSIDKKCEFLAEEKMFDELFEIIWSQKEKLNLVNKYGLLLVDNYSEQILEFYSDYVSELVVYACNRKRYDELIRYLRRMSQYTGGEKLARRLSLEWIETYPTRKVMVEELLSW